MLTWYSHFYASGNHPSLLKVIGKNVHLFIVHDPSHTNDAMKNFSSQPCAMLKKIKKTKQPKNTQMLSNSSIHLEAIQTYHAKFGGQSVSNDT